MSRRHSPLGIWRPSIEGGLAPSAARVEMNSLAEFALAPFTPAILISKYWKHEAASQFPITSLASGSYRGGDNHEDYDDNVYGA
jgi:hypothetical protein